MSCVLIVEDDNDLCDALDDAFALVEVPCVCVHSVADLAPVETEALGCQLALLDVNLGQGQPSGIDAYEWLRRRGFSGRIAFLTGHAASHPLVAKASRIPRVDVLTKPVEFEKLHRLVDAR